VQNEKKDCKAHLRTRQLFWKKTVGIEYSFRFYITGVRNGLKTAGSRRALPKAFMGDFPY
jgi:hypothetical protein